MEKSEQEIGTLWKLPNHAKLGLSLALGVVLGIALISLPALISPRFQASNTDTATVDALIYGMARSPETSAGSPTIVSRTFDSLAFAFSLFLILLPASVLSVIARRWAAKKLEKYWYY